MTTTKQARKQLGDFPVGTTVTVGQAYQGNGRFAPDGHEGQWYVVGHLAPADLKLARHPDDDYDVIIHLGRVFEANWYDDMGKRGH